MQVKPLKFEQIFTNGWRAPAPLFGHIRLEKYGSDWVVQWSVPGFCDAFVEGEFDDLQDAMDAAQTKYADLMQKAFQPQMETTT